MTLMGICARCADEKPIHVPHERRHLVRGPEGDKLCSRHAKEAWDEYEKNEWMGESDDSE